MEPKDQAVPNLNNCPTEIFQLVVKSLSPAELGVLCLVSKDLRAITEPIQYAKIHWAWQDGHHPPPITRLLRTIIRRPQLSAYITNVCLEGKFFRGQDFERRFPRIPASGTELDEFVAFVRRIGVPYTDVWILGLQDGKVDAFIALLLAQLPNLGSLSLGPTFIQESTLIGMVLKSAICNSSVEYKLPNFQHLRNVSFLLFDGEDRARDKTIKNTADILPFFYLPNIQHLSASLENPSKFAWPGIHPPLPSNLTSLHLTHIREMYLGEVLSVTQNLKTLHYRWYYDRRLEDQFTTPIINLTGIANVISYVRDSLTDLTITAETGMGISDLYYPPIKIEGSLSAIVHFNMLRRLEVPWAFLVGFAQDTTRLLQDVIPRDIEFLCIRDDLASRNIDGMTFDPKMRGWPLWEWEESAILSLLASWLKDWKNCTPHLRGISLLLDETEYEPCEWGPSMRQQFRDLGTWVGIEIEIIGLIKET